MEPKTKTAICGARKIRVCQPPGERVQLDVPEIFSDLTAERAREGHFSTNMDDKWNICFEEGWLNFYRSWTGHHIFALRLDGCPAGVRVVDGWASRDTQQYRSAGIDSDRQTVVSLVHACFGK